MGGLIMKMDDLFLRSTLFDKWTDFKSLDMNSLLYYQCARVRLLNTVDNNIKYIKGLMSNLGESDSIEVSALLVDILSTSIDQLKGLG